MKEMRNHRSSTKRSKLPAKRFYAAINENVCGSVTVLNNENAEIKYKDILGSKKPVVVLIDCMKANKIVGKHILLKYRNTSNKLKDTYDKKGKAIQDCTGHAKTSSKDAKIKKPLRNKNTLARKSLQNKFNIVDKGASTSVPQKTESDIYVAGDLKSMALEGGKKLRVLLKRIKVYDKNSNTIKVKNDVKSLRVKSLLKSPQDEKIIQDNIVEGKSSAKRARIISDVYYVPAKKIKLYRSHRDYNSEAGSKKDNKRNHTAKHVTVTKSRTKEPISEIKVTNTVNAVAQNIKTLDVESVIDNGTSHSARKIKSFGNIDKPDSYSERYTATSEAAGSSEQSYCNTLNSMKEERTDTEDEKSDCISLFADAALIEECDTYISDNHSYTDKAYDMTNDVFENYYQNTIAEFDNVYNSDITNKENNDLAVAKQTASKSKQHTSKSKRSTDKLKKSTSKSKKSLTKESLSKIKQMIMGPKKFDLHKTVFLGYCYPTINTGKMCVKRECHYRHSFTRLLIRLYENDPLFLFRVLDELALQNHVRFITRFYSKLLIDFSRHCGINCVLKIFKKLYDLKIMTNEVACRTIECIKKKGHSLKVIIDQIAAIVSNDDVMFLNWILNVLKKYINHGDYWETSRSLLLKFDTLQPEIVEAILKECVSTQKHIRDVNVNIIRKIRSTVHSKIKRELLSSFENLVRRTDKISSSNKSSASRRYLRVPNTKGNRTFERKEKSDKNTQKENSGVALHPTDGSVEQQSVQGRSGFCESSANDVRNLQEGLKRNDYKNVVNILNSVNEDQQTTLTRACYQSLSNEILCSPDQLTNLVLQSVQAGATPVFYQIIVDVAICILIDLAKKNLWVLAYRLFKDIRIIFKVYILLHKFDAATIMLFAEIYLANLEAMKAFALLKKTNIICTDPTKWKVKSNEKDHSIRVQIITLLVDGLCEASPEYAFFLFEFLVVDQYSNFHPIDLVRFANKMISVFLAKKNDELIINIAKLIVGYNFILNTTIYRALVSELVRLDMDLAKKLYQIAIGLGIYSMVQFFPTTYLIVNSNWTKEEMYLAILTLMQQLLSHIGIAIEHIQPEEFPVYLIFENVPSDNQATCTNKQNDERFKEIKDSTNSLLRKQFDPPILAIKEDNGKIHKLDSSSVLRYLKSVYS